MINYIQKPKNLFKLQSHAAIQETHDKFRRKMLAAGGKNLKYRRKFTASIKARWKTYILPNARNQSYEINVYNHSFIPMQNLT